MKKAMPLGDPVLKSVLFINPDQRLSSGIGDMQTIVTRFPNLIGANNMDRLLSEFRDKSSEGIIMKSGRIDYFGISYHK